MKAGLRWRRARPGKYVAGEYTVSRLPLHRPIWSCTRFANLMHDLGHHDTAAGAKQAAANDYWARHPDPPKKQRRQLVSGDQQLKTDRQHRRPCDDCPWSRKALPGWLGTQTPDEWLTDAHGEAFIECHTMTAQCAGAAIYRANVCKLPRDKAQLRLPADRQAVFATPQQFREHHAPKA